MAALKRATFEQVARLRTFLTNPNVWHWPFADLSPGRAEQDRAGQMSATHRAASRFVSACSENAVESERHDAVTERSHGASFADFAEFA